MDLLWISIHCAASKVQLMGNYWFWEKFMLPYTLKDFSIWRNQLSLEYEFWTFFSEMSTNINSTRHIQFTIQITEKHLHILRFFSSGAPFSGFQFPQPSRSHMTFHLLTSSCRRQPPELHERHYLPHIYVKLLYTCWWWNCQLSFKILIACSVRPSPFARLCVSFPHTDGDYCRQQKTAETTRVEDF